MRARVDVDPPRGLAIEGGSQGGRFHAHLAYRDCASDWIGSIPEHWHVVPLRWCCDVRSGDYLPNTEFSRERDDSRRVPVIGGNGIMGYASQANTASPTIAIGRVGALCGNAHLVDPPAWITDNALRLSNVKQLHLRFLYFALRVMDLNRWANENAQPLITGTLLKDQECPVPPLPEQQAIAAFLDRETAKIDALVEKKRRLTKLLKEKRAGLISHVVTKGLNPDVPMKDSGIEWLGQVPKHWSLPPLYARYVVQLGKMLDAKRITGDFLLPYLRNVDVQWDRVNVLQLPEMDIEPGEYERFTLRQGDLLVCEGGEVGRTAVWRGELDTCAYQKAIHRVRPAPPSSDIPRFLYYVMRWAADTRIFVAAGNPNTIPHLTAEKLRVYRFPFPPADEQMAIVHYLDEENDKLERLVGRVDTAIDRLLEYRTSLVSAAVTGKIDVRNA